MFEQKKPSETKKEMRFNNDEWIDMAMAWMLKTPDGKTESWQGHSIAHLATDPSNNEVPVADAKKWERMRKQADEKNKEEAEKQRGKK